MKLFTRYTLVNLAANVLIFIVASIAFYFSLRFVLIHQIDEDLQIEEGEITSFVQKHNRLPESYSGSDQVIRFKPAVEKERRFFSDLVMTDPEDGKKETYRRLGFNISAGGRMYRVEVLKSLEGTNHLLWSILIVSVLTIMAILLVSALLNRYLLKRLWKPFYASLQAIKSFRVSRSEGLSLPATRTEEFDFMNRSLEQLAHTSREEYLALKTFSENASHEIQTPIAIIRSKLDLLLQEEALTESGSRTLQGAYGALKRLSRLSKSLLLLARIGNNQFEEKQTLDLEQPLARKLEDFSELWNSKQVSIDAALQSATVCMNAELSDILLNNLLANATVHNHPGGNVSVRLTAVELSVENTGAHSALDESRIFQRFYKPAASGGQNGLGLSIVKQICEASGFDLLYGYKNGLHRFTVHFSKVSD